MQVSFASGLPADGRYSIEIWVNVEGGAWGAPANEYGSQTGASTSVLVGAYEGEAGPATAGQAFVQEASMVAYQAQIMQGASFSVAEQLDPFRQFLTRAQTMVDAAVNDHPDWAAGPTFSARLGNYARNLGYVDPEMVTDWPRAEAEEAAVNLHQAALPFTTLPYDRSLLEDYMPSLVEAAGAVFRCYR